jgi:hypothetical protein
LNPDLRLERSEGSLRIRSSRRVFLQHHADVRRPAFIGDREHLLDGDVSCYGFAPEATLGGAVSKEEYVVGQSGDESQRPTIQGDDNDVGITWADENALAIEERRVWIEAMGTPLADLQVLKLD